MVSDDSTAKKRNGPARTTSTPSVNVSPVVTSLLPVLTVLTTTSALPVYDGPSTSVTHNYGLGPVPTVATSASLQLVPTCSNGVYMHSYGLDTMHMPTVSTVPQSVTAPVIDTGNINLTPIPEIGPENDFTINVSLSIKETIQRGENVDLSTLLSNSLMHESLNSQKSNLFQGELILQPRHSPIHIT